MNTFLLVILRLFNSIIWTKGFDPPISETEDDFWGVTYVERGSESNLRSVGYANAKWNIPHSEESRFAIGSNTKLFASVAIYQLDEINVLDVTKSIAEYLNFDDLKAMGYDFSRQPDGIDNDTYCPRVLGSNQCEKITLKDLLGMNSGMIQTINCYEGAQPESEWFKFCWDLCSILFDPYKGNVTEAIKMFINLPLRNKPGIYHASVNNSRDYVNVNYLLAQYFIEKYSGLSFGNYIERNITKPLGLDDTYFDPFDGSMGINAARVDGWFRMAGDPKSVARCPDFNLGAVGAAGGIVSTNKDMHKWFKALFNRNSASKIFIRDDTILKILRPSSITYEGLSYFDDENMYFAQGVHVTFSSNDIGQDWPHFIWFAGGTACQTTMIWMEFTPGDVLIASVFSNSPLLNLDKPVNDAIMVNGVQKSQCELITSAHEDGVTSSNVFPMTYQLINKWGDKIPKYDEIEIRVHCDNFLRGIWFQDDAYSEFQQLELESGELYPLDDWTKTQIVKVPNSGDYGKIMIKCANAAHDNGPAGVMIGIKYKNKGKDKFISSNVHTINSKIITLLNTTGTSNKVVISSQTATTKLSKSPYSAQWIWTCGQNGEWDCGEGVVNVFEVDLNNNKLDTVADLPNYLASSTFSDTWDSATLLYLLGAISMLFIIVSVIVSCRQYQKKEYVDFEHNF